MLICPNKIDQHTILRGVGILRFASECVGRTDTVIFRNRPKINTQEPYAYHPEISLQIQKIYPDLLDTQEERALFQEITEDTSQWQHNHKQLQEIAHRIRIIGQHRQNIEKNYYSIIGSYAMIA